MSNSPGDPLPARWFLRGARPPALALLRAWFDLHLHHRDRVPTSGPVILACNHMGLIDGPMLASCAPRPVHALTKREMFAGRAGGFLRLSGQVPLERTGNDWQAIRTCQSLLARGQLVGVFPEGTRGDGSATNLRGGAAYLALTTGAPVVPVAILGSRLAGGASQSVPGRGSEIHLGFGATMEFAEIAWPRRRADVDGVTRQIKSGMQQLIDELITRTGMSLPGPIPECVE